MASIERYRPAREGYQPPSLPQQPNPPPGAPSASSTSTLSSAPPPTAAAAATDRQPRSPTLAARRKEAPQGVPPAVPSPPTHSTRTSPPPKPAPQTGLVSPAGVSPQKGAPYVRPPEQPQAQQPLKQQQQQSQPPPQGQQPPLANQWYFTEDEIVSTPSVVHGISPAEERARRAKGVNFIYQAGMTVQPHPLPQTTLYVAAVFFHRFYMRLSMVEERNGIHHYNIAATALFLANKTEENCFKTKNLIIAVAKVAQKNINLIVDEQSKEYWRWRDSILTYEELMLETLTFDLMVANPYNQLWQQLRRLGQQGCKPLRESAWTFLNDCALTVLPLLFDASDIASAALFFASVATREKIDDVRGQPWWHFVRADETRISRAIDIMVRFYTENPLQRQNSRIKGSPEFQLEATRRPHELSELNSSQLGSSSRSTVNGASAPAASAATVATAARVGGDGGGGTGVLSSGIISSRDVTPMELDSGASAKDARDVKQGGDHGRPKGDADDANGRRDEDTAKRTNQNGYAASPGGGHPHQPASQADSDPAVFSQTVTNGDSHGHDYSNGSNGSNGDRYYLQPSQSPSKKRKSIDMSNGGGTPAAAAAATGDADDDGDQRHSKRPKQAGYGGD